VCVCVCVCVCVRARARVVLNALQLCRKTLMPLCVCVCVCVRARARACIIWRYSKINYDLSLILLLIYFLNSYAIEKIQ